MGAHRGYALDISNRSAQPQLLNASPPLIKYNQYDHDKGGVWFYNCGWAERFDMPNLLPIWAPTMHQNILKIDAVEFF